MHMCSPPGDVGLDRLDPLSSEVMNALRQASFLRHRLMSALMPHDQTHPAQAGYLLALAHADGISQSDLATMMHVSRPAVTAMLQKAEAAGLVERRTDPSDQRVTRIFMTEQGHAAAARMRDAHLEAIECTLGRLPEADRRELVRLLGNLNDITLAALAEKGVRP